MVKFYVKSYSSHCFYCAVLQFPTYACEVQRNEGMAIRLHRTGAILLRGTSAVIGSRVVLRPRQLL